MAKDKVEPEVAYEIVAPIDSKIIKCENETGSIYEKDGVFYIKLKKIESKNKKIYEAIHSGNTNPIKLPCKLPSYSFFRKKIKEI